MVFPGAYIFEADSPNDRRLLVTPYKLPSTMSSFSAHVRLYRHAYELAAAACLGSIFYGWDIGLIGGVISMPSFKSYFGGKWSFEH
jgi:hypothetical protein